MFPTYELSINQEVTIVILTAPDDKDYVHINLDKEYMINSVSYYSNKVMDETKINKIETNESIYKINDRMDNYGEGKTFITEIGEKF